MRKSLKLARSVRLRARARVRVECERACDTREFFYNIITQSLTRGTPLINELISVNE